MEKGANWLDNFLVRGDSTSSDSQGQNQAHVSIKYECIEKQDISLPLSQEIRNSSISQSGFPCNCPSTACSPSAVSIGSSGTRIASAILSALPGNVLKYTGHHTCRSLALKIYRKK